MRYLFLDKLARNFSELLNDKEEYNVIIEVGNELDKKTFTAHSVILRYRSSYFNEELKNTVPDVNNIIKTITIQNISAEVFEIILKYIYYGIIDTGNIDTKIIYKLMIAANELKFEELSIKLESHLLEFKASWLKTHFSFVYHSIFINNINDKFKNLKRFCNDIIVKYPKLIFESTEFTSLHESALVSILKRDDLQMKESEIWDYLIKWGTAQDPTLPEKLEDWSTENFTTLKTTLQQCLPLIRYFHISNLDAMDKIKPYKKILDKQLWDDLKQHLILPDRPVLSIMLPPRVQISQELPPRINFAPEQPIRINFQENPTRVNNPFSTIINEEHAAMISSWIEYKPASYSLTNNPYEFKLILRGSEYGFAPRTFWNICHGHTNTVVISKVKGTEEIIGGFNSSAWDKTKVGDFKANNSFIFSFKDGNIRNSILSRIKDVNNALHFHSNKNEVGPRFGKAEFMLKSSKLDFTKDCLTWDKTKVGDFKANNSFIFSFKDGNIRNSILSRIKDVNNALHFHSNKNEVGPRFGKAEFMLKSSKLDFTKDCLSQCQNSKFYEKPLRKKEEFQEFSITDYEVFKVVKKI
ncbi:hypothetical protein Glove_372g31 [Diversispora epigaea]|uniref:BTB domain-containing protein n=1 Tax=Diversispora epigaea TaxID=1348612 RepID=A0A397HB14_9GLOM|nr:hypothetical protein Glove_372g31 [Diversispora epigaea]